MIEKTTPTRVENVGDTYVTLPSSTIAAIRNPDAIAILAYLLDRSPTWEPRATDVQERFGIGRRRWRAAVQHLIELGLAKRLHIRDGAQITGTRITIRATTPELQTRHLTDWKALGEHEEPAETGEPDDLPEATASGTLGDQSPRRPLPVSSTTPDRSSSLKGQTGEKAKPDTPEEPKPTAKTRRKLPADWYPDGNLCKRIEQLGLATPGLQQARDEFVDYWHNGPKCSTARTKRGWDQAFINNLKHRQKRGQGAQHGLIKNSTELFAQSLDDALNYEGEGGF